MISRQACGKPIGDLGVVHQKDGSDKEKHNWMINLYVVKDRIYATYSVVRSVSRQLCIFHLIAIQLSKTYP
jgi:hypothetical protein